MGKVWLWLHVFGTLAPYSAMGASSVLATTEMDSAMSQQILADLHCATCASASLMCPPRGDEPAAVIAIASTESFSLYSAAAVGFRGQSKLVQSSATSIRDRRRRIVTENKSCVIEQLNA